jgi:predicted enzyme related to lactoylglutathione lyase
VRRAIVHLELHTPGLSAACAYYRELLGWRPEQVTTTPWPYVAIDAGLSAGVVACGATAPVWIPYVEVSDVDEVTALALALGATEVLAPRTGPTGRRAVVRSSTAGDLAFWAAS